ncbi:hypothetical protein MGYG_01041 [Nannizzia gypsea CBS 118893]|uniref:Uncharacterized protein n=1 Tax=Arthroderma gypseum (strain ATCC MYA-4604 / CBS 118893) TaxID=535722 RepID=E5R3U5_ARTGP|nr:hypothetical protein MGYG_01041 [Nannizzia gypsea CBS 118893]EFQ98005.1 hypothetical protein MGYG_01041 [Nannizzia gypsea CBS 118893]
MAGWAVNIHTRNRSTDPTPSKTTTCSPAPLPTQFVLFLRFIRCEKSKEHEAKYHIYQGRVYVHEMTGTGKINCFPASLAYPRVELY